MAFVGVCARSTPARRLIIQKRGARVEIYIYNVDAYRARIEEVKNSRVRSSSSSVSGEVCSMVCRVVWYKL